MLISVGGGPLVAGLITAGYLLVVMLLDRVGIFEILAVTPLVVVAAVVYAYLIGWPIAVLAGLLVGISWALWRPPSLLIVVSASVLASAICLFAYSPRRFLTWDYWWPLPEPVGLFAVPILAIGAGAGCWLVFGRWVSST